MQPDRDIALCINMALAALQAGDHEAALAELRQAVARDPGHLGAFGYLALVHLRRGERELATAALREAGLDALVPLVKAAHEPTALAAAATELERQLTTARAEQRHDAFAEATLAPAAQPLAPAVQPLAPAVQPLARCDTAPQRALRGPADVLPSVEPALAALNLDRPGPPAQLEDELLILRLGSSSGPDGEASRVVVRQDLQLVQSGALEWNPLERRRKGISAGPFICGGAHLMLARGSGTLVLHPGAGERFQLMHLANQAIYVREQYVAAFAGELFWENGRIPQTRADDPELVTLRGTGFVALHVAGRLCSLEVAEGQGCVAALDHVLGWSSELVPQHVVRRENKAHVGFAGCGVLWLQTAGG